MVRLVFAPIPKFGDRPHPVLCLLPDWLDIPGHMSRPCASSASHTAGLPKSRWIVPGAAFAGLEGSGSFCKQDKHGHYPAGCGDHGSRSSRRRQKTRNDAATGDSRPRRPAKDRKREKTRHQTRKGEVARPPASGSRLGRGLLSRVAIRLGILCAEMAWQLQHLCNAPHAHTEGHTPWPHHEPQPPVPRPNGPAFQQRPGAPPAQRARRPSAPPRPVVWVRGAALSSTSRATAVER